MLEIKHFTVLFGACEGTKTSESINFYEDFFVYPINNLQGGILISY